MSALTTHLREPGDHGALAFHPGCPVCRDQRLFGMIDDRPLISVRAQAALAAGVLAVSAVGPTSVAVAAGEPPSEHEGQAAPEGPGTPGDSSQSPDFDPGGPETDLPVSVGPEDPGGESEVPEPLESEPVTDLGVVPEAPPAPDAPPELPAEPGTQEQPALDVAVPEAPTPQPPVVPSPEALEPGSPVAVDPAPVDEPRPSDAPRSGSHARDRDPARAHDDLRRQSRAPTVAPAPPASGAGSTETVPVEPESWTASAAAAMPASALIEPGERVHVVERGESLWLIARAVVGRDASIAEVAREVSRLWELNREQIGTGNPDLILPGTRLKLR